MRALIFLFLFSSHLPAQVRLQIAGKAAEFEQAEIYCHLAGEFLVRDMKLGFLNPGGAVAEGDLTCPLATGERIVSFAMDVEGVRRRGVVVPKERARAAYEAIVRTKKDPGLIEVNEEGDEFRTRVFPIPAKGHKTVWIRTVQLIRDNKVTVWPEGFGTPKTWTLTVKTDGGEAGEFEKAQAGAQSAIPGVAFSWKFEKGLRYQCSHGQLVFAGEKETPPEGREIEIWLDGASHHDENAVVRLGELLAKFEEPKVTLKIFRDVVEDPLVTGGSTAEVLEKVQAQVRSGMARPDRLPWRTKADAVILMTDGEFPLGRGGVTRPDCPLHVIDSGAGKSNWLRSLALSTGGGWHGTDGLDPMVGAVPGNARMVGEFGGRILTLLDDEGTDPGVVLPVGDWIWALLKSREMTAKGMSTELIDQFRYEHGVMDSGSSMLVLETAEQYFRYGFEPPAEEKRLVQAWQELKEKRGREKRADFDRLAERWHERCDLLEAPLASLRERLLKRTTSLKHTWEKKLESKPTKQKPERLLLLKKLSALEDSLKNSGDDTDIKHIQKPFQKCADLSKFLHGQLEEAKVVVGGQVRIPGTHYLKMPATLADAVAAAGGSTPYGAINRVKLYRNGKVYSCNLKLGKPGKVKLYDGDLIEIPQKMMFGNGGGAGKPKPDFARNDFNITITKGEWHPANYYIKPLDKALDDNEKWQALYRSYRKACGWRADFYLNVIDLLEHRERTDQALTVAGELAELLPENPEVLRKAAMAFRRLGDLETSHQLFKRIFSLKPNDTMSWYDLARSEQSRGGFAKALALYLEALKCEQSGYYQQGRRLVILAEMNAMIAKEELDLTNFDIHPGLIRHVPIELRATLEWDADRSNLDLIIKDEAGLWMARNGETDDGTIVFWSGNLARGSGPEAFSMQGMMPGEYAMGVRFYGDYNSEGKSIVTAEVEVVRNFGTKEETRQRRAIRIEEKTYQEVLKAKATPEGWK